jgi:hypothetical protein
MGFHWKTATFGKVEFEVHPRNMLEKGASLIVTSLIPYCFFSNLGADESDREISAVASVKDTGEDTSTGGDFTKEDEGDDNSLHNWVGRYPPEEAAAFAAAVGILSGLGGQIST